MSSHTTEVHSRAAGGGLEASSLGDKRAEGRRSAFPGAARGPEGRGPEGRAATRPAPRRGASFLPGRRGNQFAASSSRHIKTRHGKGKRVYWRPSGGVSLKDGDEAGRRARCATPELPELGG